VLIVLVAALYLLPLGVLPLCGEETRWAQGAREMLQTGDWIVTRQQGAIHADRPPLGCWAMAAVGAVWGRIDVVAVRLPSVLVGHLQKERG